MGASLPWAWDGNHGGDEPRGAESSRSKSRFDEGVSVPSSSSSSTSSPTTTTRRPIRGVLQAIHQRGLNNNDHDKDGEILPRNASVGDRWWFRAAEGAARTARRVGADGEWLAAGWRREWEWRVRDERGGGGEEA